jgi:type I restriction enzyme S subunit
VCEINMGQSPPGSTYNTSGDGLPFFQGKADFGELHPTPRVWCIAPRKLAEAGDVLISVRAPVGPTNIAEGRCAIGRGLAAIRPLQLVDAKFVFYALRGLENRWAQKGKGSTFEAITKSDLQQFLIPLPPLSEQRRIVARLDELMVRIREARRLREEAKRDAERLWQAVLAETFPRPGAELPDGWRWVRLGEVAKVFAGSSAPQGVQYFQGGSFPFVRVQDLGRYGTTTNLVETADLVNETAVKGLRLRKAKAGAILFPKSGGAILTNSRAILGRDAYIVSHLAAVEPDPSTLNNLWAFYWLCTVNMSQFIDNPSYPSLRLSKIKELRIPLPPLSEQHRIVAYLDTVQAKIEALKEAQATTDGELQRLEQAILQKAFRGEL